jgi:hypothetical protein
MKKRAFIILIACAFLGFFLWLQREKFTRGSSTNSGDDFDRLTNTIKQGNSQEPNSPLATDQTNALQLPFDKIEMTREEKLRISAEQKNIPIRFWGKVVDQNGDALPGVKIKTGIRHWIMANGRYSRNIESFQETGPDGLFQVLEGSGDVLGIDALEKEGYELPPKTKRNFGYNISENITPDPANPIVFRMWKKVPSEDLLRFDKDFRIPYDGTPVSFDLVAGKRESSNSSGDLRVTLLRQPLQIQPRQRFDWIAKVEMLNGGLLECVDDFGYLAPDQGYKSLMEFRHMATDTNWTQRLKIAFYVRIRGGQMYGKVSLDFRTGSDRETTGFSIASSVNPSGSRSLQP